MWQTIWQRFENFKRILKEHRRIRYADIIQRRSKVNINEADLSAIRGEKEHEMKRELTRAEIRDRDYATRWVAQQDRFGWSAYGLY